MPRSSTYIQTSATAVDSKWDGKVRCLVYDTASLSWVPETAGENNLATVSAQIIAADDLVKTFTWSDVGTTDQRVSQIVYASSSLGKTLTKTFAYTHTSGVYRLDTITKVVS